MRTKLKRSEVRRLLQIFIEKLSLFKTKLKKVYWEMFVECCLERNFRVNWDLQMIQNEVKLT